MLLSYIGITIDVINHDKNELVPILMAGILQEGITNNIK
jgi:hypothetical protein